MKNKCFHLFLFLCCCFLFGCQTDKKPTPTAPVVAQNTPKVVPPKPGTVATPADISRPDKMTNNFERMQGEWQQADNVNEGLQVRGKVYLEINGGANRSELAHQFKVVKECEGAIDLDGEFFMVGSRCFKLMKISIEEMEVEDLEQQKLIKYKRI